MFSLFSIKKHVLQKQTDKQQALQGENTQVTPLDLFVTSNTLPSSPPEPKSSLAQEGFALVSLRTRYGCNRIAGVQLRTDFGWQNLSYWSCNV